MEEGVAEIKKIINYIQENNDFSIFYHLDGDGIASAAIIIKAIEYQHKDINSVRPTNYEDFEGKIDLSEFSDNIILCDMQVSNSFLLELKTKNSCIIDHHELIDYIGIHYINPKMWGDNTYTPCSLLTYRIFESIVPESGWIAAIGLVSDAGGKEQREWLKTAATKYGVKLKEDEYLYDNEFGLAASMLNSMTVRYGREGADEALGILLKTKSLATLINNEKLLSANNTVKNEIHLLRAGFEHEAEQYEDLVYFYEVPRMKKRYSSAVITPLSIGPEYYGKVIVFMSKIKADTMRINMRANGLDVKLPVVLKSIFRKIKGNGGGHDHATGATIHPKDKEKFKLSLVEEIKRQLKESKTQAS